MSKGGSTTGTTSIDPDLKKAFLANLEQAQGVAGALPVQEFAGFNPLYEAGEKQLVNTALAGPGLGTVDEATYRTGIEGTYQPAQVQAAQANLGMGGGQGISAGLDQNAINADPQGYANYLKGAQAQESKYPGSTSFGGAGSRDISAYMNPYTKQVRENALADLETSRQNAIRQTAAQAGAARAFGGSRQGVAEAQTNLGFGTQAGRLSTQLNEQAFNQAMQAQQQDLARQQQAMLANQVAGLSGAQYRLGVASQLGNLGAQQQGLRYAGGQAVMGAGGARQQLLQQQLDAQRNIGIEKLRVAQSALGQSLPNLGITETQPYTRNVGASILGGAATGYKLGGGNPYLAALGGLLGAF